MIGPFAVRIFILAFGYAYPAYKCFKTEQDKPETEKLLFWLEYWILIALFTMFERVGDVLISWLPMYNEAKVVFIFYLWFNPKISGATYVYNNFLQPCITKHETGIRLKMIKLRGNHLWEKNAIYLKATLFAILLYSASQLLPLIPHPDQKQLLQQPQVPVSSQPNNPHQHAIKDAAAAPVSPAIPLLPTSSDASQSDEAAAPSKQTGSEEAMQVELRSTSEKEDSSPPRAIVVTDKKTDASSKTTELQKTMEFGLESTGISESEDLNPAWRETVMQKVWCLFKLCEV